VNLIQRLKIWKELRRLEHRVREEPSPSRFVDLGQVFINLEMVDRALQAAEDGLALFPDSVELTKLRDFARRNVGRVRVSELRARINKNPDRGLYRELAGVYRELGDHGALHATCEEWGLRYPDDAGAWLVLGQARLANYYRDLSQREGLTAVQCLERVLALDGANTKARSMLAELLYRIGATEQARAQLEALPREHDDQTITALRRQVANAQPSNDGVEDRLRQVEEDGVLTNAPPTAERPALRPEDGIGTIRDALAQIAEMRGVRKAAYIKGSRALVKGNIRNAKDPFLRVVRVVAKASQTFGRRLDIGGFNKGILHGRFGRMCICCYGEVLAAVQCDDSAQVNHVLAELQDLVAGSLYSTGVPQ
jgi:tetratricopeptide (TPR) repeat protein